jgi:hypothetical protein
MDNIRDPYNNTEFLAKIFKTMHGDNHVVEDSIASVPKTNIPQAPPADTCNTIGTTSIEALDPILLSIGPNPIDQFLMINYVLNQVQDIQLSVFNNLGQQVHHDSFKQQNKGNHNYYLSTEDWPAGNYFLQLKAGPYQRVEKVLKLR